MPLGRVQPREEGSGVAAKHGGRTRTGPSLRRCSQHPWPRQCVILIPALWAFCPQLHRRKCEVRPRGEPGFLANNMTSIARHLRLPPRRIVLWHSLSAVPLGTLIAIGAYLSYHYHDLADQNQQRVNRSYQLLDGIDRLFSSVEAAALAERDFVITGDADALEQFQRSITAFRSRSLQLRLLVKNEPTQAAVLSDIDQTIAGQFSEFSQAIETRNSQGYEGARVVIALQATGVTMEALRQKIDKFAESERSLVNDGLLVEKLHEHRIIVSGIAIAISSLLVRLVITLWVRRTGRLRPDQTQAASFGRTLAGHGASPEAPHSF